MARGRVLNAVSVAVLAALGFVIWDAISLRELDVPFHAGAGPSAIAGIVAMIAAVAMASALFASLRPPLARWRGKWRARPARAAASWAWGGAGWVLVSATSMAIHVGCQHRVVDDASTRLAVSLGVAGTGTVWVAARPAIEAQIAHRFGAWPRVVTIVAGVSVLGAWVALVRIAIPILEQLDLRPLITWSSVFAGAIVGVLVPLSRATWVRWLTLTFRAAAALVLCAAGVAISYAVATEEPRRLDLALEMRATSTGWIVRWLRGTDYERVLPVQTSPDRSAVCSPDAKPPTLTDVVFTRSDADIIFITVDALRYDHTSLSDYARDTTPNLARHATHAAVFERAYSISGSTRHTFRALFTGVYPSGVHEVRGAMRWGFGFTDAQVTLAEYLRHAGYETVAFSAIEGIMSSRYRVLDGFTEVDESASRMLREGRPTTDHLISQVVERLKAPRRGRPRFIWTHLMAPHHPYPAGPDPVSYGDELVDRYDAAIHFADRELGRLLELARSPERVAHTWVIVTADHGEEFYEHGGQGHSAPLYEEHVRVPMVIWGPDVVPRRYASRISQIHLHKTLLEIGGVKPPDALCGESLVPTLLGNVPPPEQPVYMEVIPDYGRTHFRSVLIRGDIKTTVFPISGARQLFDLSVDPTEQHDLAVERPDLLARELQAMRALHLQQGRNPEAYGL